MQMTIKDIARLAGTSPATVSLVLNNKAEGRVSAAKRKEILALVRKYGYRTRMAAKGLRLSKTFRIGVCFDSGLGDAPVFGRFSMYDMVRFCADRLHRQGYGITLVQASSEQPLHEVSRALAQEEVDGLLFLDWERESQLAQILFSLAEQNVPAVSVGTPLDTAFTWAGIDYTASTLRGMEHLHAQGCRRIVLLAHTFETRLNKVKRAAYESFLDSHDLPRLPLARAENFTYGAHIDAAKALINNASLPDAIFMTDNLFLPAVQQVVASYGIRLLGYGDACFADVCSPPIEYLRMPVQDLSNAGVDLLLARIDAGASVSPQQATFVCELCRSAPLQ